VFKNFRFGAAPKPEVVFTIFFEKSVGGDVKKSNFVVFQQNHISLGSEM